MLLRIPQIWVLALAIYVAARHSDAVARRGVLFIPLIDMPLTFFLMREFLPRYAPNQVGPAAFTLAIYVVQVVVAAFSLDRRYICLAAAMGTLLEVWLLAIVGVPAEVMVGSAVTMGMGRPRLRVRERAYCAPRHARRRRAAAARAAGPVLLAAGGRVSRPGSRTAFGREP
jgi:hypothetical protein